MIVFVGRKQSFSKSIFKVLQYKMDKFSFRDGKHVPALLTSDLFDLYHKKMLQKKDNHALENQYFPEGSCKQAFRSLYNLKQKWPLHFFIFDDKLRYLYFSEKDNSFKRFILLCNFNYVQQKTRKH